MNEQVAQELPPDQHILFEEMKQEFRAKWQDRSPARSIIDPDDPPPLTEAPAGGRTPSSNIPRIEILRGTGYAFLQMNICSRFIRAGCLRVLTFCCLMLVPGTAALTAAPKPVPTHADISYGPSPH